MNDYERLIARVKEVNRKLAMLQMTSFGQFIESTNAEEENWNEGSASALQAAKELVEKVIEEFPDRPASFSIGDWVDVYHWGGEFPGKVVGLRFTDGNEFVDIHWPHLDLRSTYDAKDVQSAKPPKVKQ